MRKNNCEVVRRELDELMPGDECSTAATEHLHDCASCREFKDQTTKLRQIVGSLGTVEAPADFDFRLRARLAQSNGSSVYSPFLRRGLAVAAMAMLFVVGAVVLRNAMKQSAPVNNNVAQQPEVHQPAKSDEVPPVIDKKEPQQAVAIFPEEKPIMRKAERRPVEYRKPSMATVDRASTGANVINGTAPVHMSTAFPIDASVESFKVSLDDGRGNAKTISVPTISFGSQRIVQSGKLAPKRVW